MEVMVLQTTRRRVEVQTPNSKVEMETNFKGETNSKVGMETNFRAETNIKVGTETINSKVEIIHFQMQISFKVGIGTIHFIAVAIKRLVALVETKVASMVMARETLREDSMVGSGRATVGTTAEATTGKVGTIKHRLTVRFTSRQKCWLWKMFLKYATNWARLFEILSPRMIAQPISKISSLPDTRAFQSKVMNSVNLK